MIPEHRVMVLDRYGEPEIGELLSEVVRGRSMEEQRALLLSQLSGEDVGKVEAIGEAAAVGEVEDARGAEDVKEVKAAEPKAEEDFDDDMLDIDDDEGEGLERAGKSMGRYSERRPTNISPSRQREHRSHYVNYPSTPSARPWRLRHRSRARCTIARACLR
jgi:hypothetical protein